MGDTSAKTFKLKLASFNCKNVHNECEKFDFINNIMLDCDIFFIQEHRLHKSHFNKLATLGGEYGVEAKGSMDESVIRKWRLKGGCAIVWNPMIQSKITPIVCNNTRLCGIMMEWINNKCLILNVYMPYDVGYDDGNSLLDHINVMHEVKLLIDTHNPTHIIYGGGDTRRNSPQTQEFQQFVSDCDLQVCINMNIADVRDTYIGTNSTSKLDHFLVSQNLPDCVLDFSIIDNHLHSDHVSVTVTFDIDVVHNTVLERTYVTRVACHEASNDHIDKYKTRLDILLSNIQYDIEAVKCNDRFCSIHKVNICNLYGDIISASLMLLSVYLLQHHLGLSVY